MSQQVGSPKAFWLYALTSLVPLATRQAAELSTLSIARQNKPDGRGQYFGSDHLEPVTNFLLKMRRTTHVELGFGSVPRSRELRPSSSGNLGMYSI